jgi:hypothetical protein
MEFIKNEKEREKTFFKLWNEEVNINPQNYRFIFGNDIQFFRGITQEELEKIFEFLKEQFGEKNIIFATVHKDETTPHLHAGFIPMTDDGRLSYKNFVNSKYDLIKLQDKYFEKMVEFFPELERGQNSKETKARHLANQEYKIQQKEKAMELQLEQINKNAMELEEKKKKLEAKKERLKTEDEKLYDIEKIMECVKENKGFFQWKSYSNYGKTFVPISSKVCS